MKQPGNDEQDLLYESLLQLKNVEECRRFMEDLCTVTELKAMRQRIEVAMYLRDGLIYQDILKRTGASSATISRVNRCLRAIRPFCPGWTPCGRRRRNREPLGRDL